MKSIAHVAISAVTAFGVASVASPAANAPMPVLRSVSPPSAHDVNRAQSDAINALKNQNAQFRRALQQVGQIAQDASDTVSCIDGAAWVVHVADDQGERYVPSDSTNPDAFPLATLDPACLEDAP